MARDTDATRVCCLNFTNAEIKGLGELGQNCKRHNPIHHSGDSLIAQLLTAAKPIPWVSSLKVSGTLHWT